MSLATLGSKLWSPIHHGEVTSLGTGKRPPQTQAERMAAARALTRHAVLTSLAVGCVAYGLLTALTFL